MVGASDWSSAIVVEPSSRRLFPQARWIRLTTAIPNQISRGCLEGGQRRRCGAEVKDCRPRQSECGGLVSLLSLCSGFVRAFSHSDVAALEYRDVPSSITRVLCYISSGSCCEPAVIGPNPLRTSPSAVQRSVVNPKVTFSLAHFPCVDDIYPKYRK